MSWRGLRPSILAIAAALGSAAAGAAYAEEPPRASGAPALLLAQNNEEADEQKRKRREERQERRERRKEEGDAGNKGAKRGDQSGQQDDKQQRRERQEAEGEGQKKQRGRAEQRRERQEAQGEGQKQRRGENQAEREEKKPSRSEARKERIEQEATGATSEEPRRRRRGDAEGGDTLRGDRAAQRNNAPQEATEEDTRKKRRERGEERRDDRRERADDRKKERRERADDRRKDRGERAEERVKTRELTREERRERRKDRQEFTREKLKDITRERRRTEEGGRVTIEEPGKRRIIRERGRTIIEHDETERLRGSARNVEVERGPRGRTRTVITRPNGVQIINVEGRNGRLLRRIKRMPNGREIVLINNEFEGRRRGRRFRGDDDGYSGIDVLIDLPDLILESAERRRYYANTDEADEEELYEALSAPPVEELEDNYTLDEIRYSPDIRKRLRKINLNNVTFASGSWEVPEAQIDRLAIVAKVINRIIENDQDQVILVSGHTDGVGSDEDNLSLSDRRAETVARILTDEFSVPPENLVTQGYGESDLLIETEGDEPRNRRVEFMRITPFLAQK